LTLEKVLAANSDKLRDMPLKPTESPPPPEADGCANLADVASRAASDPPVATRLAVLLRRQLELVQGCPPLPHPLDNRLRIPVFIFVDEVNAAGGASLYPTLDMRAYTPPSKIPLARAWLSPGENTAFISAATRRGIFKHLPAPDAAQKLLVPEFSVGEIRTLLQAYAASGFLRRGNPSIFFFFFASAER
jgi:hypothetical protein